MSNPSDPCNFSTLCNTVCSGGPTIQLFHCDRDTSSHLSLLQCSEKISDRCMQFYDIPEAFLILYRSGIFSIDSSALKLKICDSHREYFGIQWRRKQIRCIYQGHSEKSRSNADRGACPTLCKLYWLNTRQILPVGAGLCKKCATLLRKDVCNEQVNFENELDINSKSNQDMELAYSQSSVTDTFEGFSELSSQATTMSSQDWLETQMTTKDRFNAAMKMLSHSFEPLNCQLSKPWSTLSKSSRSYYLKKTHESIRLIFNVIAPGQEDVLLDNLQQKDVSIDSTTRCIIDAFHNASNSRTQIQILSNC
ncbi:unnamed protein product [Mytilus coruscus]|uniref:Uncharacterized protein n=1 Tax=Mytilus coruscus TaxID=42192 RepID=A0A6J8BVH4_MYTCO|nr:unnamed protein product [Mytilus coruscus]